MRFWIGLEIGLLKLLTGNDQPHQWKRVSVSLLTDWVLWVPCNPPKGRKGPSNETRPTGLKLTLDFHLLTQLVSDFRVEYKG